VGISGNPWPLTACPLMGFTILVRKPSDTLTTQIFANMILEETQELEIGFGYAQPTGGTYI